ncbi:hypothetical protein HPB50_013987 [Hyalomma asiaticum]|uniref:Uncharacterized protein n=1 Tax=Hyalomma asiaticum TaxID=266040 RepID=A0ACB7S699_HYAAI|nr:hypothetical protein HPB50_013987 [Hyalomma asiaticum]
MQLRHSLVTDLFSIVRRHRAVCHRLSRRGDDGPGISIRAAAKGKRSCALAYLSTDCPTSICLGRLSYGADHAPKDVVNAAMSFASAKLYRMRPPGLGHAVWARDKGEGEKGRWSKPS